MCPFYIAMTKYLKKQCKGRKTILAQNSKGFRPWSLGSVLEQNIIEVYLCIKNVLYLKVDEKQ